MSQDIRSERGPDLARPHVTIYTDGAASGNPGPGGYGTVLLYKDKSGETHRREYSGGFRLTTNNRMELLAVIVGMEKLLRPCRVDVYADSQYVVKAFTDHWVEGWKKRGWKNSKKEAVKNTDLWKRLLTSMEGHDVTFHWVKGHAGNPENERCDALAVAAGSGKDLPADLGYEKKM